MSAHLESALGDGSVGTDASKGRLLIPESVLLTHGCAMAAFDGCATI
jgi:hypothetical protein